MIHRFQRRRRWPRTSLRRGSTTAGLAAWSVALALFVLPFLRDKDAASPEGDDWGRGVSEVDLPFAEDLALFEEDFELELADVLHEASERYFGLEGEALEDSGLFHVQRLEPGRIQYERHCVGCHGSIGDGAGPAARHLEPRPRNFRKGVYKFTSTETGSRPLRSDLFGTITRGLYGSSMPNFRLVGEEHRHDLVEYVRYLSIRGEFEQLMLDLSWEEEEPADAEEVYEIVLDRWSTDGLRQVYPESSEPERTAETVAHGRALYMDVGQANCVACHGETGRGDGPSAAAFLDDWGYPILPRDFTAGVFRAGSTSADLYRSIATGINGTPMGAFGGSLEAYDIWCMVHFVQQLAGADQ